MQQTAHKTISIIDDDDAIRRSIVSLIRSTGYKAREYLSADAYLGSGDVGMHDCIITDVYMPGRTGLNLIRVLRNTGYSTPVILMTANLDEHIAAKAAEAGAVCLLRKPFDSQELLDCIERALARPAGP